MTATIDLCRQWYQGEQPDQNNNQANPIVHSKLHFPVRAEKKASVGEDSDMGLNTRSGPCQETTTYRTGLCRSFSRARMSCLGVFEKCQPWGDQPAHRSHARQSGA